MNCTVCGRAMKHASASGMGPKCARKRNQSKRVQIFTPRRKPADQMTLPLPFDLDRACAEAVQAVDAFIARRAAEIQQQLRAA